jgi:Mg2+ and Co2+ transporter CorA
MRVVHIQGDQLVEFTSLPEQLPDQGYLWVHSGRREFEVELSETQAALQRWAGGQLFEPHVSDLLSNQLPSHFDYTSWYDVLVFRRLAAGTGTAPLFLDETQGTASSASKALNAIDTSPVGFALFDGVLLTVHPTDCLVRDFFTNRLHKQSQSPELRGSVRLPNSPADLMLRMVNHMVDSYLELRRLLTRQLGHLQQKLLDPKVAFNNWTLLLESRNSMHLLEDTCEDQRSAVTEWIDALDEWPDPEEPTIRRERELLRVRSRDILEHIERVLSHVRRLETSVESAVQIHFSQQSHRTNNIMRTLTVITAIFMPLNLVTGFFGMNFEALPLIHSMRGFWVIVGLMSTTGLGLSVFFWRKRYLGTR